MRLEHGLKVVESHHLGLRLSHCSIELEGEADKKNHSRQDMHIMYLELCPSVIHM